MKTIKEVLMERDGMDEDDAQDLIDEAKETIEEMLNDDDVSILELEEVVSDYFGLEPDYLFELMPA